MRADTMIMRRGTFVGAVVIGLAATRGARAGVPQIGFLSSGSAQAFSKFLDGFREGLSDTGFTDGVNVTVELRWADGRYEQLPALAAELVGRDIAVLVAS